MKKLFSAILVLGMVLLLFTACGGEGADTETTAAQTLTGAQAQQIVWEDLGVTQEEVSDVQIHMGEMEEGPAFSVQFTYQGQKYEYIVLAESGQILYNEIVG